MTPETDVSSLKGVHRRFPLQTLQQYRQPYIASSINSQRWFLWPWCLASLYLTIAVDCAYQEQESGCTCKCSTPQDSQPRQRSTHRSESMLSVRLPG